MPSYKHEILVNDAGPFPNHYPLYQSSSIFSRSMHIQPRLGFPLSSLGRDELSWLAFSSDTGPVPKIGLFVECENPLAVGGDPPTDEALLLRPGLLPHGPLPYAVVIPPISPISPRAPPDMELETPCQTAVDLSSPPTPE